jgi:hypothetical protein
LARGSCSGAAENNGWVPDEQIPGLRRQILGNFDIVDQLMEVFLTDHRREKFG